MNSLYDFIVKPIGEGRYNNSKKIGEKELILNTKIESWKFVNRFAKVVSTPLAITTNIKKGDIIVVHQNVFRRFYNMKGKQTNSRSFFKNDLYFVSSDQIYLYKNKGEWQSFGDRCFIKPIKNSAFKLFVTFKLFFDLTNYPQHFPAGTILEIFGC